MAGIEANTGSSKQPTFTSTCKLSGKPLLATLPPRPRSPKARPGPTFRQWTSSALQNRPWSTCEAWKSPGQDFRYFFIATNAHLARGEESFSVQLSSEPELHAKVAYIDDNLDIAFVKAEDPSGILAFRHLTLRDSSDVRQGEIVMAIGNPGDAMRFSATQGIVSAVGEFPNAGPGTWIQTDAPINPGNSGGPLLNLRGEVVGINTQKLTLKNVTGIGFALSASHLVTVLRRFYPKEPRHGEKTRRRGNLD